MKAGTRCARANWGSKVRRLCLAVAVAAPSWVFAAAEEAQAPVRRSWAEAALAEGFGSAFGGADAALSGLLGALSSTALLVGGLLAAWSIVRQVAATAHEGKLFAGGAGMWGPIRLALGTALVIPTGGGFCLAQLMAAFVVAEGSSLADGAWDRYLEAKAEWGSKVRVQALVPAPAHALAETALRQQLCVEAFNRGKAKAASPARMDSQAPGSGWTRVYGSGACGQTDMAGWLDGRSATGAEARSRGWLGSELADADRQALAKARAEAWLTLEGQAKVHAQALAAHAEGGPRPDAAALKTMADGYSAALGRAAAEVAASKEAPKGAPKELREAGWLGAALLPLAERSTEREIRRLAWQVPAAQAPALSEFWAESGLSADFARKMEAALASQLSDRAAGSDLWVGSRGAGGFGSFFQGLGESWAERAGRIDPESGRSLAGGLLAQAAEATMASASKAGAAKAPGATTATREPFGMEGSLFWASGAAALASAALSAGAFLLTSGPALAAFAAFALAASAWAAAAVAALALAPLWAMAHLAGASDGSAAGRAGPGWARIALLVFWPTLALGGYAAGWEVFEALWSALDKPAAAALASAPAGGADALMWVLGLTWGWGLASAYSAWTLCRSGARAAAAALEWVDLGATGASAHGASELPASGASAPAAPEPARPSQGAGQALAERAASGTGAFGGAFASMEGKLRGEPSREGRSSAAREGAGERERAKELLESVRRELADAEGAGRREAQALAELSRAEPEASGERDARTAQGRELGRKAGSCGDEKEAAFERARLACEELSELADRLEGEAVAAGGKGPAAALASQARSALSAAWGLLMAAVEAGLGKVPSKK